MTICRALTIASTTSPIPTNVPKAWLPPGLRITSGGGCTGACPPECGRGAKARPPAKTSCIVPNMNPASRIYGTPQTRVRAPRTTQMTPIHLSAGTGMVGLGCANGGAVTQALYDCSVPVLLKEERVEAPRSASRYKEIEEDEAIQRGRSALVRRRKRSVRCVDLPIRDSHLA